MSKSDAAVEPEPAIHIMDVEGKNSVCRTAVEGDILTRNYASVNCDKCRRVAAERPTLTEYVDALLRRFELPTGDASRFTFDTCDRNELISRLIGLVSAYNDIEPEPEPKEKTLGERLDEELPDGTITVPIVGISEGTDWPPDRRPYEMDLRLHLLPDRSVKWSEKPCCRYHNRNCEPPYDLCCDHCTEVRHPSHTDGLECIAPDLTPVART
jgi:hypothetical protein